MLDADERAFPRAGFADDERRRAPGSQLARIRKAGAAQTVAAPERGRIQRGAVGCFAGDRAKLAELFGEPLLLRRDEAVEIVLPGHVRSMPGDVSA